MSDYEIGKDIGKLFVRVKNLEKQSHRCTCRGAGYKKDSKAVSDEELIESLYDAAPNEEVFETLRQLVTDAGHITIRELFSYTRDDVNPAVISAIKSAKKIGFLTLSNDKCCHEVDDPFQDDYCKEKKDKWCSLVKKPTKYMCTLASDKC